MSKSVILGDIWNFRDLKDIVKFAKWLLDKNFEVELLFIGNLDGIHAKITFPEKEDMKLKISLLFRRIGLEKCYEIERDLVNRIRDRADFLYDLTTHCEYVKGLGSRLTIYSDPYGEGYEEILDALEELIEEYFDYEPDIIGIVISHLEIEYDGGFRDSEFLDILRAILDELSKQYITIYGLKLSTDDLVASKSGNTDNCIIYVEPEETDLIVRITKAFSNAIEKKVDEYGIDIIDENIRYEIRQVSSGKVMIEYQGLLKEFLEALLEEFLE